MAKASTKGSWAWLVLAIVVVIGGLAIWQGNRRVPGNPTKALELHGTAEYATFPGDSIRIGTFNIHGGKGDDDKVDLERTAALLDDLDIVALNEVDGDLFMRRNQAGAIADSLDMAWVFAPTERRWWHDHFGNALLTNVGLNSFQQIALPGTQHEGHRNAILATFSLGDQDVRILATHIDRRIDRQVQLAKVIDLFLALRAPAILMGDLNTRPDDPQLTKLLSSPDVVDAGTIDSDLPDRRIDWIIARGLRPVAAGHVDNDASDHPLVWAEFAAE
ncbi:MAG: endonuclease/exonuclease/phosphatase family protein [Halioglobus sp.]|jgi:endonuclease/exonuclease/phosphatase family metal-dependent hydrolase|nr:endonuclease/exonuclease/phosphatase family protein [Halioglobus sp.]